MCPRVLRGVTQESGVEGVDMQEVARAGWKPMGTPWAIYSFKLDVASQICYGVMSPCKD